MTVLDHLEVGKCAWIRFRTGVVKVDAAPGNVLKEVALELDAHWRGAFSDVEETRYKSGNFVREIAPEDGRFETNYH